MHKAKTTTEATFEALMRALDVFQFAATMLRSDVTYRSIKVSVKSRIIPL